MKSGTRQRRLYLGAAASLLLHVLLAAWLVRSRPAPLLQPPRPKPPAIEIALQERPARPPAPSAGPSAAERKPSRPPATAKRRLPAPARLPPAAVAAKPVEPASAAIAGKGGADSERWSSAWRADEGLDVPEGQPRGGATGGGLAMALPSDRLGDALGIVPAQPDQLPRAEAIVPESSEVAKKRIQGRIDGFAQSFNAHERAQVPDIYWRNFRDELAKAFKVPYELYDQGGRGGGRMAALAQQYGKDLGAYGKTGNPFVGEKKGAPGAPYDLQEDVAHQQLAGRGLSEIALGQVELLQRNLQAATSQQLVARILVSQLPDGTLADVALIDRSGNTAYDRLALQQAKSLVGKELSQLGPLPREGRRSLWAFETDFTILPPLPIAGCALDAYFVPRECYHPLKKMARSRVRLEALY